MQKQLETTIEQYKNSKTTLEAYEAISDFIEIVESMPDFIKQVEDEGEKIRLEKIELNADKGWNYGLAGRELKLHNEYRARKSEALHQLDPMFPLINLGHIRMGIQPENIADNSDWLFRWTSPDEQLREIDKKEFQTYLDKVYRKILPFLKVEETEEAQEEIKVKSYDEKNKILIIGNYKIRIAKNEGNNNAHEIMSHIFVDHKDDLSDKFDYSDIAEQRLGADYNAEDKNAQQPYSGACKRINQTIKDQTNGEVKDFLIYNHSKLGYVKINPIYL